MRRAIIYLRKKTLFVRACSQTTAGVWIDDGPCETISIDNHPDQIGRLVAAALGRSIIGVEHPTSWTHLNDLVLAASGVRSWTSFGKSAKCVNLEEAGKILVKPTKNQGNRGGFVALTERFRELPAASNWTEVGEAIKLAYEDAE